MDRFLYYVDGDASDPGDVHGELLIGVLVGRFEIR